MTIETLKKGLFFAMIISNNIKVPYKIIAFCLSISLIMTTATYAVPSLRLNSLFDDINKNQETGRLVGALSKQDIIDKRVRPVFEKLRPNFKGKHALDVYEFEKHIEDMAQDMGVLYERHQIQPRAFLDFYPRLMYQAFKDRKPSFRKYLLASIMLVPFPMAGASSEEDSYAIAMPTLAALSTPFISFLIFSTIVPVPYIAVVYFFSAALTLGYMLPTYRDSVLHELTHVGVFLYLKKLSNEGLISLSVAEATDRLPQDHGLADFESDFKINKGMTVDMLNRLEDLIINSLYDDIIIEDTEKEKPKVVFKSGTIINIPLTPRDNI